MLRPLIDGLVTPVESGFTVKIPPTYNINNQGLWIKSVVYLSMELVFR